MVKQILIELDDEMAAKLEHVAPARSHRRSAFIRQAIWRALWELEEKEVRAAYLRDIHPVEPKWPDASWDPWPRDELKAGAREAMKQLEVRWVDLPPPAGCRPVLLMSRTPALAYLNRILVAEITPTVRGIPQEVLLGEQQGLPHVAVVNMDALQLIDGRFLGDCLGEIAPARHLEVKRALGCALDWAELKALA